MITIKKHIEIELEIDGEHSPQEGSRSPHSLHYAPADTIIEDIRVGGVSLDFEMWNVLGIDEGELQQGILDEYIAQAEYKNEMMAEYKSDMRRMENILQEKYAQEDYVADAMREDGVR